MDTTHLMTRISGLLALDEDGKPHFPEQAEPFINGVIEVAARLPEASERQAALTALVRLSLALQPEAPKPAEQLMNLLRQSPAALQELARALEQDSEKQARFDAFSGTSAVKRAPRQDAPEPESGIKLSSIAKPMPRPRGRPAKKR